MYPSFFKDVLWFSFVESSTILSIHYVSSMIALLGLEKISRWLACGFGKWLWLLGHTFICSLYLGWLFVFSQSTCHPQTMLSVNPGCYPHYPLICLSSSPWICLHWTSLGQAGLPALQPINILHPALLSHWLSLLTYWLPLSAKFAALCLFFVLKF